MGKASREKWTQRAELFRQHVRSKTPTGDRLAAEMLAKTKRPDKLMRAVEEVTE